MVCANDYMAAGAHIEFMELGYRIPEDIALVGFDDIHCSKCLIPSLSSISYPVEKMAARALTLLLALLEGKEVPEVVSIPTEFIPRPASGTSHPRQSPPALCKGGKAVCKPNKEALPL